VPPYLLAVRRRSLGKLLEQLAHLLGRHADAGVGNRERDPAAAVLLSLVSGDGDSAFLGELVGVARKVEQGLSQPRLVGMDGAEVRWAVDDEAVGMYKRYCVLCATSANGASLATTSAPHEANSSSKALACFKSSVSKPSVNQP